jgi:hypothetical protein
MNVKLVKPAKPMFLLSTSQRLLALIFAIVLAGCASPPKEIAKPVAPPPPVVHKPVVKKPPPPKPLTGLPLITSLLPASLPDRSGWAADIYSAFVAIRITPTKENSCAVVAEIEQESAFQADPGVPGLKKIVRRELETRRAQYRIPQWLMEKSLAMKSANGHSYDERIEALKTENDVNKLFEDMISEVPFGNKLLADYNPVRTGGPMQVSSSFAAAYMANKPYPYALSGSVRNELFTRKGGVYFGIAYLLDYPANYDSMTFRFADFNSGIYSSRNAAFQQAVSTISGKALDMDGDLLRYKDGVAQEDSQTMRVLLDIASRLNMDKAAIYRDLQLEKSAAFEQSPLYSKVFALAPGTPHARIPEIVLNSPKFSRKLTTAMYAKQVDARYKNCMKKNATGN